MESDVVQTYLISVPVLPSDSGDPRRRSSDLLPSAGICFCYCSASPLLLQPQSISPIFIYLPCPFILFEKRGLPRPFRSLHCQNSPLSRRLPHSPLILIRCIFSVSVIFLSPHSDLIIVPFLFFFLPICINTFIHSLYNPETKNHGPRHHRRAVKACGYCRT